MILKVKYLKLPYIVTVLHNVKFCKNTLRIILFLYLKFVKVIGYKMLGQNKYVLRLLLLLCIFLNTLMHAQSMEECDALNEKADVAAKHDDLKKSIEIYLKVEAKAKKLNWPKQWFNATLGLGNNYFFMLDYGTALNYYTQAYDIAIKAHQATAEIAAINNIANLYTEQKLYDKAIEYYTKAYDIAKEKNIDERKGLPLLNLGNIYNILNQPKKARPYITESMPYLDGQYHSISAKISLVENDMLLGDTKAALKNAMRIENTHTGPVKAKYDASLDIIIAKCYLKENNFPKAIAYAKGVAIKNPNINLEIKNNVYELLSDIYSSKKSYNLAMQYRDSVSLTDRQLSDVVNRKMFESNRIKFEIQNYENQIKANKEKLATERKLYYSAIAVLLALVTIIILFFRQKRAINKRNQHSIELKLEKEKNTALVLEKQMADALLTQKQLKNEIDIKNRKLSSKALYLSDRNELIEEIVSHISKNPLLIKDANLIGYVNSLNANLRSDNEWDNFITHFEEVNRGFLNRIKSRHPSLSENDIRFIAYIYMNLNIKEISSILNITIVACKKRKERLAAKMEISKDEDLFNYISNLR